MGWRKLFWLKFGITFRLFRFLFVFHVQELPTQVASVFGARKPRESSRKVHEMSKKVTVWCSIHAIGLLESYYYNNKSGSEKDYYLILSTHKHSEARELLQVGLLRHDGAFHIRDVGDTTLNMFFPTSFIERYGPQQWPPRYPDLMPSDCC